MNRPVLFYGLFILLVCYYACTPVKTISSLYSKKVKVIEFKNEFKTVKFIPMHHIGKPEFYASVAIEVMSLKDEGYIVYYESARMDRIEDSVKLDEYKRKFRKMLGVHIDSTGYAKYFEKSPFKNMIDQPAYKELGVTNADVRVDLPQNKLVDAYEEKYGIIELAAGDKQMPFTSGYPRALRLPKDQVMSIIIDHRNRHLAEYVHKASDKKIVILFGAIHVNGTFDELKNLDNSWKKE
jgi:hypothetical protein